LARHSGAPLDLANRTEALHLFSKATLLKEHHLQV
jgi:hypothetical protein